MPCTICHLPTTSPPLQHHPLPQLALFSSSHPFLHLSLHAICCLHPECTCPVVTPSHPRGLRVTESLCLVTPPNATPPPSVILCLSPMVVFIALNITYNSSICLFSNCFLCLSLPVQMESSAVNDSFCFVHLSTTPGTQYTIKPHSAN